MPSTRDIRTKIGGIKKTQKITRAMEMVAASKMRRAQEQMFCARPYADRISQVIRHVAGSHPEYQHPFMEKREVKRAGYIVVCSDRGLCGGLNTNLLKLVVRETKAKREAEINLDFCAIGVKAENFFSRYGGNIVANANHLGDAPVLTDLIGVVKVMLDAYSDGQLDALYIASNEFINTMIQKPRVQQLLPIVPEGSDAAPAYWDYIYEPDNAKVLLTSLLTRYIESQVYRAVVENNACFQAAQMVAMKSATDNAGKIIDELQLAYNKARQAAITRELAEIVAGAAAV